MKTRLEYLLDYYKEDPDDAFTSYALALEYIKNGELNVALNYFTTLRETHRDYLPLYYHLAKLYETINEKPLAAETYITGMKLAEKLKNNQTQAELKTAYNLMMGIDDDDW